jgi:hypothetical protein
MIYKLVGEEALRVGTVQRLARGPQGVRAFVSLRIENPGLISGSKPNR